jgi:3-dehydroquinate dehydratase type I
MDLVKDGKLSELLKYIRVMDPDKPILVTCRKAMKKDDPTNGASGKIKKVDDDDEPRRWEILKEAVRLGAEYVDVELEDDDVRTGEVSALKEEFNHRTKLICSHHDFTGTPALKELTNLYQACLEKGGDVVKIVPYANSMEDNLRVLELLAWAKEQGPGIIAFCMGEKGRISRIAAHLFGALFTFAALDDRSVAAPGQIAAADMRNILGIIGK